MLSCSLARNREQAIISQTGSVLGVDVGCSPTRRSSAVCRLDWNEGRVSWTIERFRAVEPEQDGVITRVAGAVPTRRRSLRWAASARVGRRWTIPHGRADAHPPSSAFRGQARSGERSWRQAAQ